VQEAFIELAQQPREPDNIAAWLYRVVRNRALNDVRTQRRRARREHEVAVRLSKRLSPRRASDWLSGTDVAAALNELPDLHREIVVLRVWSNLNYQEIAEVLDCSVSTAHRRYTAAIEQLREILKVTPCRTEKRCSAK